MSTEVLLDNIARDYGGMVSAICSRMIQDRGIAEDAAQEVWVQIVSSIDSFKGSSKLSTWIYKIAQRVIISYCKNERIYTTRFLRDYFRGESLDIPDEVDYDNDIWIKEMCDKCMTGMLHCLDNESRLIYLFRDVAKLDYETIAYIFDKDEAAVRKTVSRARPKLKSFLENECILYNPNGKCNCRMKKLVLDIKLQEEYEKLRKLVGKVNFFIQGDKIFPKKNFWQNII